MYVLIYTLNNKIQPTRLRRFGALLKNSPKSCSNWRFPDKYSPKFTEDHNFQCKFDNKSNGPVYSVALPPPNVTGSLHLGHALSATLQDVLVRWHRLRGNNVSWIFGTDHAGIATQALLEKHLQTRQTSRLNLGYDQFQDEIWNLTNNNQQRIRNQLKQLGLCLDWSKENFTMDKNQSLAVRETFIRLFDQGLVYRKHDLVNWSCQLQTAISDIEIDNLEVKKPTQINVPGYDRPIEFGTMTKFAYKLEYSEDEVVVATTRPETMLGDVAVAVNPNDSRYSHLIGRNLIHPFVNKKIPIIFDERVDINFGTGAVKITPAHDRTDYAIAKTHSLPIVSVIDEAGKIEDGFAEFSKLNRYDARNLIIEKMKGLNLLREVEPHKMIVPICSRSGDVIELLPRAQWYINCKEMSRTALESVRNGKLELVPEHFESKWCQWLEEEKDWCISRQLWWGHRIPVYKCYNPKRKDDYKWIAAFNEHDAENKARDQLKSDEIICEQENDVLDTWFSSALYPFSTHGWPKITEEYKKAYPLNIMVTGHDILCFWVIRMVMFGAKLTDQLPFPKVLLHGIICDANGGKMSKSKGNVINPEDVIHGISLQDLNEKALISHQNGVLSKIELNKALINHSKEFPEGIPECGADALRFTLCSRNVKQHYINFDVNDCHLNKLFCNKIWQSLRYTNNISSRISENVYKTTSINQLDAIDLWLLSKLSHLVEAVEDSLNNYDFHNAVFALKQYLYYDKCDFYIECSKLNFKNDLKERKLSANLHTLSASYDTALRLLSPFMPYLAHKLIPSLRNNCIINYNDSVDDLKLMEAEKLSGWKNKQLENNVNLVIDVISTVRKIKSTHNIPNKVKTIMHIEGNEASIEGSISSFDRIITSLSGCDKLLIKDRDLSTSIWSYNNSKMFKIYIELLDVDSKKFLQIGQDKFSKKREDILKKLDKLERTMSAEGFKNAPENVQISHRIKVKGLRDELDKIEAMKIENAQ